MKPRNTKRKLLIQEVLQKEYGGSPVLLEELRWKVFFREYSEDLAGTDEMTVSYMNSFTRTIRTFLSSTAIRKIKRPDLVPCGLLTRAAMFRVRHRKLLFSLMYAKHLIAHLQIVDERQDPEIPRNRTLVICKLYEKAPIREKASATICFPTTQSLTLIGDQLTAEHILKMAEEARALPHRSVMQASRISQNEPVRTLGADTRKMLEEAKLHKDQYLRKRLEELLT